jgi:hypothetical protein
MLAKDVLDDVFEQQWPGLEGSVKKILKAAAIDRLNFDAR